MEVTKDISPLEEECKITIPKKLIFRIESGLTEIYICKKSGCGYCRHQGLPYTPPTQNRIFKTCNYVPQKNNC